MSKLSVSIPEPLAQRLAREVERRQETPDAIVEQALERTLPPADAESDGTFFEAARAYLGMFEGPSDLSTNPRYLDDFGK